MANEITFADHQGTYSYDYRLLRQSMVDALYPINNLLQFLRQRSLAGFEATSERFPKEPVVAATALVDGQDMQNTPYVPDKVTLTVGEVGVMMTITDLNNLSSIGDIQMYGMSAGKAIAKKLTGDIAALGSGFSASESPASGNDLTEANFLAARTALQILDVPGPYYAVLYPQQLLDLVNDIGTTLDAIKGSPGSQSIREATNNLAIPGDLTYGTLHDVFIVANTMVPTANAGADSAGWMAAYDRALAYVEKWGVRPALTRDESLRGTEVLATAAYAVGELDDASGVKMVSDR